MSGREDERKRADEPLAEQPFEDDGHTIADMSEVDGLFGRPPRRRDARQPQTDEEGRFIPPFTPKERRAYVLMAVGTALAIGLVFLGGLALVILLMLGIWSL